MLTNKIFNASALEILGLFIHWHMSCDYTTFVIQSYDKCRIIA